MTYMISLEYKYWCMKCTAQLHSGPGRGHGLQPILILSAVRRGQRFHKSCWATCYSPSPHNEWMVPKSQSCIYDNVIVTEVCTATSLISIEFRDESLPFRLVHFTTDFCVKILLNILFISSCGRHHLTYHNTTHVVEYTIILKLANFQRPPGQYNTHLTGLECSPKTNSKISIS